MKALITVLAVFVVLGLGFFLYSSPTAPPEMTEAERAQHEAEVREELTSLADSYADAFLSGDAEALMSLYTSDVRIYWTGMNFTRDELQDWVVEAFQTTSWTGFEIRPIEFFVHGDAAYTISEVSETFQMEGQEAASAVWNCFTRFEREDGIWRADRDVCGPRDAPPEG